MARGSLAGIVSGVVVSGVALGVVSLGLPPVEMGAAPPGGGAGGPAVIEAESADAPGATDAQGMADPDMTPETGAQPEAGTESEASAMPDAGGAAADAEMAPETDPVTAAEADPEAEPLTGDETGADPASAPAEGADDTPKRGEAAEAEIMAQPTGTPLPETVGAPQMESDPVKVPMGEPEEPDAIPGMELVEKLPPALPPASVSEDTPTAEGPEADTAEPAMVPETSPEADPDTGPDNSLDTGPDTGPDTSNDKASGSALVVEPDPEPAPDPEPVPAPDPAPDPGTAADTEPAPEIATIVAEPAPVAPQSAPQPAPAPEPEPAPESAAAPAPGLSGADTVVTGRLPTIGDEPAAQAPLAEEEPVATEQPATDLPAIERNRIEFAVEGSQPLLALMLLDSGDRTALADIGKLPFPLTVAIDASAPDAAEAIEFYGTRGIEVALLLPLPDGATASDVDVTVEAYGPLLDAAAEVVVDAALGFQALGPGAVQLATNLAESGHGLVSFPSGLNTGHKSALKQGVPAGLVFLDLDGDGQGGPVIRRFLDNAAFRARNENGVIVLARTRPETLQALLEWSLGSRAQTVALAPISAVLLAQ